MRKIVNPLTGFHIKDHSGEVYGEWTVIGLSDSSTTKRVKWECLCSCGTRKDLDLYSLKCGGSRSCGCKLTKYDLTGQIFGRLHVIDRHVTTTEQHKKTLWECRCDCGKTVFVNTENLVHGQTRSCGCLLKETTGNMARKHDKSGDRLYGIFHNMHQRCKNPNDMNYPRYGARGVYVCDEWDEFEVFYQWAYGNGYANYLSLDRIDVNGPYAPWNCRWATALQQANNKRNTIKLTHNNKTQSLTEWANELGVSRNTLASRYQRGWSVDRILEQRSDASF